MSAATWLIIAIIGFSLAGIALIIAIFMFIKMDIPSVIGDLSGKTVAREIKAMREFNDAKGKRKFHPGEAGIDRNFSADKNENLKNSGRTMAESHASERSDNAGSGGAQRKKTYNSSGTVGLNDFEINSTEVLDDDSCATEVLSGNATEVLIGDGTEVLRGNGTEVLRGNGTEVLRGDGTEVLRGNGTEVLRGDGTEVLRGNGTEVLRGNGTEVLRGNGTEVLRKNETEVLRGDGTEVLRKNETEVLRGDGTEVLRKNETEVLRVNGTEVLNENATEVLRKNKGPSVSFKITKSEIVIHTDEVI